MISHSPIAIAGLMMISLGIVMVAYKVNLIKGEGL